MTESSPRESLFSLAEILEATGGALACHHQGAASVSSVAVDSRVVKPGALFVALPGERTDGHRYARQAVEAGASALLLEEGKLYGMDGLLRDLGSRGTVPVVGVASTLAALHDLARFHMRRLPPITRIGVTGSSGKTTTKEILGSILSRGAPVAVNPGNLNSEIGLPLACFAVNASHRYAIFEMGMNHAGEMDVLADIVRPGLALITNIGTAHIGLLGSKELIAQEKKKIFAHFTGKEAGFIPEEEAFADLLALGVKGRIVRFGPKSTAGFRGSESLGLDGTLIHWEGLTARFPLFGRHNLFNALGAIAVARELGVTAQEVREGLEAVTPLFGRSQIIRGPVTVLFDCYNANPDSMANAVSFVQEVPWKGRKLAVLGSMRELGGESQAAHEELGRALARGSLDGVMLFGEEMEDAWRELRQSRLASRSWWTADFPSLADRVRDVVSPGDLVLVKGSRSLELERLLPVLTAGARSEAACS